MEKMLLINDVIIFKKKKNRQKSLINCLLGEGGYEDIVEAVQHQAWIVYKACSYQCVIQHLLRY